MCIDCNKRQRGAKKQQQFVLLCALAIIIAVVGVSCPDMPNAPPIAPAFTAPLVNTAATNTATSAYLSIAVNKAVTLYWVLYENDVFTGDALALKYSAQIGVGVAYGANIAMDADATVDIAISDLTPNTEYDFYALLEDEHGSLTLSDTVHINTAQLPQFMVQPTLTVNAEYTTAEMEVSANRDGVLYWVAYADSVVPVDSETLVADAHTTGGIARSGLFGVDLSADTLHTIPLTNLAVGTKHDLYTVFVDTAGNRSPVSQKVNINTRYTAKKIAAGDDITCAILNNDQLKCWGDNEYGALGYGHTLTIGDNETPASVGTINLGSGLSVAQVSVGGNHVCVLLNTGKIKCWGGNQYGQLGQGNAAAIGDNELPATISPIAFNATNSALSILTVQAGNNFTCALLSDNKVRCWGRHDHGHLGYGDSYSKGTLLTGDHIGDDPYELEKYTLAQQFDGNLPVVQLAVNLGHSCLRRSDNTIKCWGDGLFGALGYADLYGTRMYQAYPGAPEVVTPDFAGNDDGERVYDGDLTTVNLGVGNSAKKLYLGYTATCAILQDDSLKCWGQGIFGALGYGNADDIGDDETPASVGSINLGTESGAVVQVVGSSATKCVLFSNTTVKCWGANDSGYLAAGHTTYIGATADETPNNLAPVAFGTGFVPVELTAGKLHYCARFTNNTIKCWGYNTGAALGYGHKNHIGDNELLPDVPPVDLGRPIE